MAYDPGGVHHYPDKCIGLCVWVDGQLKASAAGLDEPLKVPLI